MAKPVFDKRHVKEYLLFGSSAAVTYMIPVIFFLYNNSYEHLYYLFIGCALFMAVIFYYVYRLLYARYDKKRAVSMLIAGHLATLTGILIASILVVIGMLFFNADLFSTMPTDRFLPGAAPQDQQNKPAYLLLMMLATATIGNFAVGSFISVIVSYAGKRDQTRDKAVDIGGEKRGLLTK
ncbi:MAG: hypothetical protein ABIN01_06985 [Ferruginibacter sp.]